MIYYEDLLTVPYKEFGRDKDGMDCYGLVLEMCRRNGTPLIDFIYHNSHIKNDKIDECLGKINVRKIEAEERKTGDIIEWDYENTLHVGFLLDKETVIHATYNGVRITPVAIIKNAKYGKVEKWQ